MKRDKHSLSHYKLATLDMGALVPVGVFEVLPGDSVQQSTSVLLRCSPLMAPVMHPVSVRIHHWFVPYRLCWDGWEDFITGGPDGQGGDAGPFPSTQVNPTKGELWDYLGVPPGQLADVSLLPLRAYNLIYNNFYRDQDLSMEAGIDSGVLQNVAWEKDYFTAARPWPQKGPDVVLPIGTSAPVIGNGAPNFTNPSSPGQANFVNTTGAATVNFGGGNGTGSDPFSWGNDTALYADLSAATGVNVNDVRLAFALQRYQEARAKYGSRYVEYLRYLGIRSSDARLQLPEYLGGGKQTISFSEVLQTAPGKTEGDPTIGSGVGSFAGHGIAATRSRRYRRFFEEHGVVLSLMSVRPRTIYTNGLPRFYSRRTKEDFFQRELQEIGQQEIYSREIYARPDASGGGEIFGYQDRYSEYKQVPSSVHGDFRDILNYWHLARDFSNAPALNSSFVSCYPSKRIFAEQTTDTLWCMVSNNIQARRMVKRSSASRVL